MNGRKYWNDDDDDSVLRSAVMAPFYHDYRATILHATRRRYSSLQLFHPLLPLSLPLSPSSPYFLTFAPLKSPLCRALPSFRRQSLPSAHHLLVSLSSPSSFIPRCHLTLDALLSSGVACIRDAQKPPPTRP